MPAVWRLVAREAFRGVRRCAAGVGVNDIDQDSIEWLDEIVSGAASVCMTRWPNVTTWEDAKQECWLELLRRESIWGTAKTLDDDKRAGKYVLTALLNALQRFVNREKAAKAGFEATDQAFYTTDMIAAALPYALEQNPELWTMQDAQPDPDELSRGGGDPAHGGTRLAVAMDIRGAYRKLSWDHQQLLADYYLRRCTQQELAERLEVARVTVQRRLDAALATMQAHLGGVRTELEKARGLTRTQKYAARRAAHNGSNAAALHELRVAWDG